MTENPNPEAASGSRPLEPAETDAASPAPVPPAGIVPPARGSSGAELSPAELWDQGVDDARQALDQLARETTQRDWLIITRKLDRSRQEIGADSGLTLLALAWVKEKREHGGASWDRLLDMTDAQLEAIHGFPAGDRPED